MKPEQNLTPPTASMNKVLITFFLLVFLLSGNALFAAGDKYIYNLAVKSAEENNNDIAYMYFRQLLRDYPRSPYAAEALFGQAEYFFLIPDYKKAYSFFDEYVQKYPHSPAAVFAWAYLLKMARIQKDEALAKEIEKKIISIKQVGLVFADYKEYEYQTPLRRKNLAVFHIDKIEFYVDHILFAKISY